MPFIIEASSRHTCAPWVERSQPSTAPPPTSAPRPSAAQGSAGVPPATPKLSVSMRVTPALLPRFFPLLHHQSAQCPVDPCLVAASFLLEPGQHIGIETQS